MSSTAAPATGDPRTWRPILCAAALTGAVLAAWATSFRGVFVYDDHVAIVNNPNIRALWPLTTSLSAPAESPVSARPVAALSLAVNYALAPRDVRDVMKPAGPGDPPDVTDRFLRNVWGYHAVNLVLHLGTALLLAGVTRRTLDTPGLCGIAGGASVPAAFAAAAIWAVHPLTTDAVTYVAQRTEGLMGLCYLLTLYAAIRAGDPAAGQAATRRWTAVAVLACLAGMGSKQTMVLAPVVVWAWDWMFRPEQRSRRRPLYLGLAASWLLLAALVAHERWPTSIGFARDGWTPWTYLLTQTTVIAHYVRLAVAAGPLSLDYDGWPMTRSVAAALPFGLPLVALLVATLIGVHRRRAWAFPLLVWFAALAPSSSVLPLATEIAAERRMYLPLAAMIALVVPVALVAGRRGLALVARGLRTHLAAGRIAAALATVLLGATLASMTSARNREFWSEERIWRATVRTRPDNPRARLNYGVVLADAGRFGDAERELREAVRLRDTSAPAHVNLGSVLCRAGRLEEGLVHLERGLALDPDYSGVHSNLAEAYGALGRRAPAARHFALAVDRSPDNVFLLNRLGWLLATAPEDGVRDGARAISIADRAVRLTGRRDPVSLDTLAAAYAEAGRFEEATATAREALTAASRSAPAMRRELEERLVMYVAGRPYRDPPPR